MFPVAEAPVPAPPPNPIKAVIVFVVTAVITVAMPAIGSGKPVVLKVHEDKHDLIGNHLLNM